MTTAISRPIRPRTSAFTGHETFHLRQTWLSKGLNAVGSGSVNFDDAGSHHELGIGINMLKSLAFWMQATGVARFTGAQKGYGLPFELTDIGKLIAAHDPYIEDVGTLWVIQHELACDKRFAPLWYWVFNILRTREFTDESALQGYARFIEEEFQSHKSTGTAQRDLRCLKRTYGASSKNERSGSKEDLVDCPLADLSLVKESLIPGHYSLRVGSQPTLPLLIYGYAVLKYRESFSEEDSTISADDLRWSPCSPGRTFCLDATSSLDLLESLDTKLDLVRLNRGEGISQIAFPSDLTAIAILEQYYESSTGVSDD
jgi:hypothetical protein